MTREEQVLRDKNVPECYVDKARGYVHEAFMEGVHWADEHPEEKKSPWCNADEVSEDGDYLTILSKKDGRIISEIAPWRGGKYQGCECINVYVGNTKVIMCSKIEELIPSFGEITRSQQGRFETDEG